MHEIVIVEDSESDAQVLERTLSTAGVTNPVRYFRNGTEALFFLQEAERNAAQGLPTTPAVLFLDLKLPGASGLEILAAVRNRAAFAGTLRIVLTQFGDFHSIKKAYVQGADSFLSKPIKQEELAELIVVFPRYWLLSSSVPPV